jgi:post-segregation antitoxin (ccd killing protein)
MSVEEKKKMVHFNITIPEELYARMKEHPEVNWSRVAARAFEKHFRAEEILRLLEEPGITDEEAARRVIETRKKLLVNNRWP